MEVTSVTVLPADEEPAATLDGEPGIDENTAADWLPGIRDEHDDGGELAGELARTPDLGPDGHAEHPQANGPAAGSPAALTAGARQSTPDPAMVLRWRTDACKTRAV